jgi:hypothetical protein
MAAVLYYGNDDRLPKIMESFFANRKTDAGEIHSLTPASDIKKMEELLISFNFDLVFVETAILDRGPTEWLSTFQKKYSQIRAPFILIGDERSPMKIMKIIESGFTDYIVNPPDKPLILEKFMIYTTGKRSRDLRQVYSMKLSEPSDLAKPGLLEELSEFDCKIRSSQKIELQELMIIYAPSFSEGGLSKSALLGRCYDCQEHPSFKGQYISSFYFVGATPDILVHIRKSLQKAYVASKAK